MIRFLAVFSLTLLVSACSKLPKMNPSRIADVVPGGSASVYSERLFERGQVELSSNGGVVLDEFAAKLIANDVRLAIRVQKDDRITIRRDHQPMFSERARKPYERALRISSYLQQKGVPGDRIRIIRDPELPVLDAESRLNPPFELLLLLADRELK